jgi:hypothetical protein
MAGPKNPEQLRGALGAFRRRLQEVETPRPSVEMKLDTGLDPSKAPVPVRPQFQAPMIPEEPTAPYKGVEDIANRLLNAPVDRRQFLEGARSGAAALSQVGKLGPLGRLAPEIPSAPVDLGKAYYEGLLNAIKRAEELPLPDDFAGLTPKDGAEFWSSYLDEYSREAPTRENFSKLITEEVSKLLPKGIKVDEADLENTLDDLVSFAPRVYVDDLDFNDLMDFTGANDKGGIRDWPDFLRSFMPPGRESPFASMETEKLQKVLSESGLLSPLEEIWNRAVGEYSDKVDPEEWPDWLRKYNGVEED